MKFNEVMKDLFTADNSYYIAHCISSDCAMGAGIARLIEKRFKIKRRLLEYPIESREHPTCILVDRIFNLITKEYYYNKPTYNDVEQALICMRDICLKKGITKIAMPTIASDLDKLNWLKVKAKIIEVFSYDEIEILVCRIK